MTNKIDIRAALVKHHSRYRQPNESIITNEKKRGETLESNSQTIKLYLAENTAREFTPTNKGKNEKAKPTER